MSISPEIEDLLSKLTDRDPFVRQDAIERLWEIGANNESLRKICLVGIRAGATDPFPYLRDKAISALGEIGNRNDIYRIRQALGDDHWIVRCAAACSLGQRLGKGARRELEHMVCEDTFDVVRAYAAVGLADAKVYESISLLEEALTAERSKVAATGLISALILLGRLDVADRLPNLMDDPFALVRNRTLNVIVGDVLPALPEIKLEIVQALVEALRKQSAEEPIEWMAVEQKEALKRLEENLAARSS